MTYYVLIRKPSWRFKETGTDTDWVRCIGESKEQIRRRFRGDTTVEAIYTEAQLYTRYGSSAGLVARYANQKKAKRF